MSVLSRVGPHIVFSVQTPIAWLGLLYAGLDRRSSVRHVPGVEMSEGRNGIVVARFQSAVLWSVLVMLTGGLLSFFAFRMIGDYDRINAKQDADVVALQLRATTQDLRIQKLELLVEEQQRLFTELRHNQEQILAEVRKH